MESELRSADLAGRFLGEGAESGHARGLNVPTARFRGRVGIVGRNRDDDLSQLGHALGGAARPGQRQRPEQADAGEQLSYLGISADDIRQLLAANPRRFLGLPESVSVS